MKRHTAALLLILIATFCLIPTQLLTTASAAADSWATKAPMNQARSDLGVAVVNGKIYAIGGCTANGLVPNTHGNDYQAKGWITNATEEYDPTIGTWTFKSTMPTARYQFAITSFQNKIYCIGGVLNWASANLTYTGINEVYDPETDTWETKAPMPTATTGQAHLVGDKIYFLGGRGQNGTTLNQVYDPSTDSWRTKAPLPARSHLVSAVTGNKIYAIAYQQDIGVHSHSNTFIYDPVKDRWSSGDYITIGFFSGRGIPWRGNWWSEAAGATTGLSAPMRVYVFFNQYVSNLPLPNLAYDPAADSWNMLTEAPTAREGFGVVALNDRLYLIGGYSKYYPGPDDGNFEITPLALVEEYTPLDYGKPDPNYVPPEAITIPKVTVTSPINQTYNQTNVTIDFTVDKTANWIVYSLDGKENATLTSNITLTDLSTGMHNITIYAKDTFGNVGVSERIDFMVIVQTFPTGLIVAVSIGAIAIVCVGVFYWRIKIKKI
ncbi:MAG TPA: kelch repeat-containing protein [Candidatus Acidoferrales bacterium]|nr:kelch repeat-containing protein [Candidatus Acidoferrales bacterium]